MTRILPEWWFSSSPPEPIPWNGDDDRPMPSVGDDTEDVKEREWHDLESHARDFIRAYGVAAMLRCISESTK